MYKFNTANARGHRSSYCRKWRASKMKRIIKLTWIFTGKTWIKANQIPSSFRKIEHWQKASLSHDCLSWKWTVPSAAEGRRKSAKTQNFKVNIVITANKGPYTTFHWVIMSVSISIVFVVNVFTPSIFSWKKVWIMYLPLYKSMKWYSHFEKCVFLPILSSWDNNC